MRKYKDKSNSTGELIQKIRIEKNLTPDDVCKELQARGISIDRSHLYRIEKSKVILKDFELITLCKILDISYDDLKSTVEN